MEAALSGKASKESVTSSRRVKGTDGENFFMNTVFKIVSNCPENIGGWNDDGESFIVKDTDAFAKTMFPSAFSHSNWSSFARQLNSYGFVRVKGNEFTQFKHPLFLKGSPELLTATRSVKRSKNSDKSFAMSSLISEVSTLRKMTHSFDSSLCNFVSEVSHHLSIKGTSSASMKEEFIDEPFEDHTVKAIPAVYDSPVSTIEYSYNLSDSSLSEDEADVELLMEDKAFFGLEQMANPLAAATVSIPPLTPETLSIELMVQTMKGLSEAQQREVVDMFASGFARKMAASYAWNHNGQLQASPAAMANEQEEEKLLEEEYLEMPESPVAVEDMLTPPISPSSSCSASPVLAAKLPGPLDLVIAPLNPATCCASKLQGPMDLVTAPLNTPACLTTKAVPKATVIEMRNALTKFVGCLKQHTRTTPCVQSGLLPNGTHQRNQTRQLTAMLPQKSVRSMGIVKTVSCCRMVSAYSSIEEGRADKCPFSNFSFASFSAIAQKCF